MLDTPASDSLSASDLQWLIVQHDWRALRDQEAHASQGISEPWHPHHARDTDERLAELASRPYAALADGECAWLVAERTAQRSQPTVPAEGSSAAVLVYILVGVAASVLGAYIALAHLFGGILR